MNNTIVPTSPRHTLKAFNIASDLPRLDSLSHTHIAVIESYLHLRRTLLDLPRPTKGATVTNTVQLEDIPNVVQLSDEPVVSMPEADTDTTALDDSVQEFVPPIQIYTQKTVERFWAKVDKGDGNDNDCFRWTAFIDKAGRGKFWAVGKNIQAHRFSWELANGRPVPEGQLVVPSCGNPSCVNPNHLHLATFAETHSTKERTDAIKQGMVKAKSQGRKVGGRNGLSQETIGAIKEMVSNGMTKLRTSEILGVSYTAVKRHTKKSD